MFARDVAQRFAGRHIAAGECPAIRADSRSRLRHEPALIRRNPHLSARIRILSNETSYSPSATNTEAPTVISWGFFLSICASSRVLLGVPAEACGLRQPPKSAVPGHIPLSPGHSSPRPPPLQLARSPQRPQRRPIRINGLRADESSGWIAALATRVSKRP